MVLSTVELAAHEVDVSLIGAQCRTGRVSLCVKNWEMPSSARELRQNIERRIGRPSGPGVSRCPFPVGQSEMVGPKRY